MAQRYVDAVRNELNKLPNVKAYYPGVGSRLENFQKNVQSCEVLHPERGPEGFRVFFVPDVDKEGGRFAVREEAFGPAIAFKFIDGNNDPRTFLDAAVKFCNTEVFGSLSLNITISPESKTRIGNEHFDECIRDLEWGAIGVNVYAAMNNAIPCLRWGAFPGKHATTDIQSGQGEQGNVYLVDSPAKGVVYGPFTDPLSVAGPPTEKSPNIWAAVGRACLNQTIWSFVSVPRALLLPF